MSTGLRGTDQAEQIKGDQRLVQRWPRHEFKRFHGRAWKLPLHQWVFAAGGAYAWFWTSTPTAEGDEVYTRELSWNPIIERNNYSLCCAGYSVRCVEMLIELSHEQRMQ